MAETESKHWETALISQMSKGLGIAEGVVAGLKAARRPLGFLFSRKEHLLGKFEWEPACRFERFGVASTCSEINHTRAHTHTHTHTHRHAYCRTRINYVPDKPWSLVSKWQHKTDFKHYDNCHSLTLLVIRLSFKMEDVITHLQSVIACSQLLLIAVKPSYPEGRGLVPHCSIFPNDLPWQCTQGCRDAKCFHMFEQSSRAVCHTLACALLKSQLWFSTKPPCFCSVGCMFLMAGRVSW